MSIFVKKTIHSDSFAEPDTIRPQMTSLIDILTLLLVFLIQSFSAEGNLITPSEDLQLPISASKEMPRPALTIEITQQAILSEGKMLATLDSTKKSSALLIEGLYAWVLEKRKGVLDTAGPQEIIIQCDRDMKFNVVKRVMYTCSRAGFKDFSVLTIEG